MLAGYNIFRENSVRHFWSKYPDSRMRPLLIQKLYPYLQRSTSKNQHYLSHFFKQRLEDTHLSYYSHLIRWKNTSRIKRYFDDSIREQIDSYDPIQEFEETLGKHIHNWHPLHKAQFIESKIFLSNYLLSSQGDRVSMAHSVEGRYPFLDHHFIQFCCGLPPQMKLKGLCGLPPQMKLKGLNEKYILKKTFNELIPQEILKRDKHPYRAPIVESFLVNSAPEYVKELLSDKQLEEKGYFRAKAVKKLIEKWEKRSFLGEVDEMAIAGILSVQLLDELFLKNFTNKADSYSTINVNIHRQS